jgi:hypothetical protein
MPPVFPNGLKDVSLPVGAEIVRVHQKTKGPIWFGPAPGGAPANRFDATGGEYRTLYAAAELVGAFVETILHKPAGRIVRRDFIEQRAWSTLRLKRKLQLAKLYDEGLLWHGTDAAISASDSHAEPRRMALALHAEFPSVDGVAYRARHNNGAICYALFDRAATGLEIVTTAKFEDNKALVDALMAEHGAVYDTSAPVPPP